MKAYLPDVDLDEGGTTLRRLVGALSSAEELIDFLRFPGGTTSFLVIPSSRILQQYIILTTSKQLAAKPNTGKHHRLG